MSALHAGTPPLASPRLHRCPLKRRTTWLIASALALGITNARAEVDDTLKVLARYELLRDSNLFRLSPDTAPPNGGRRSDQLGISTLGLVLDKSYSLQRIRLNTSVVNYRYQNFDYLGFTALNYDANWSWSVTPRIRGTLVATRRQVSNSFSDTQNTTQRNIRTDNSLRLDGEADLGAAVRLLAGVDQLRTVNEEPLEQEKDSDTRNAFIGARYVFRSGNNVSYRYRQGQGRYLNRLASDIDAVGGKFDVAEHELRASWAVTGKTSLNARLAYLDLSHTGLAQNDFSEPIGELGMRWKPTAKLTLDAIVAREVRPYQTAYSSYWVGRRFILAPSWAATAHTSVQLRLQHFDQDYTGGLRADGFSGERRDTTRAASVGLDWRPRDSISVRLWLQNEKRSSTYSGFNFTNRTASIAGQFTF
jgi:exopolysaccharide biosynthesis operon protein EpsL